MLTQLFTKGRRHRYTVKHRINRNAGELLLFFQRNPEFLIGFKQLRIDFIEAVVFGGVFGGDFLVVFFAFGFFAAFLVAIVGSLNSEVPSNC